MTSRRRWTPVAREALRDGTPIVAAGLLAIGMSGALAAVFGAALGKDFVAGDPPGVTYTASRCADFREYHPEATSCAQAAAAHHFDEVVQTRLAAGVLGLLVLAAWWLAVRRRGAAAERILPDGLLVGCAFALYAAAAAVLGLEALDLLVQGGDGAGYSLSAALVAVVGAVGYGRPLLRVLERRAAAGFVAAPPR